MKAAQGKGYLVLSNGRIFTGKPFGAAGEAPGELVFNTGMSGYQEILTDPSYCRQIVVMTCPHIGNYGTNPEDDECDRPWAAGLVIRESALAPSSWRSTLSLHQYLQQYGVVGLEGVDTRAVTRLLRTEGAMPALLCTLPDADPEKLAERARRVPGMQNQDLAAEVSRRDPIDWNDAPIGPRVIAYDYGIKRNILRCLAEAGFRVRVVPAGYDADRVLDEVPDGVLLSNGPGDPAAVSYAVSNVRRLIGRVPIMGICLGHQILALAAGGRTYKLKFGHRGINHPVKDAGSGRVLITSQNHGFAVDPDSLPAHVRITHTSLYDGTVEGMESAEMDFFSVQFHPEASPGPHDARGLFARFRERLAAKEAVRRAGRG